MKIQDFFKKWISTRPNLKSEFHDVGIEAMAFAEAYHNEQLRLHNVSNCSSFKEDDLSKAYQAGALETYAEEIQPLTYDAIKQVEQNSLAWIKRWKE